MVSFSATVGAVGAAARGLGLVMPVFRSPPLVEGADRTVRRIDGSVVIAVRVHGRPPADVVADVIDGVLLANGLEDPDLVVRRELLAAVEASVGV